MLIRRKRGKRYAGRVLPVAGSLKEGGGIQIEQCMMRWLDFTLPLSESSSEPSSGDKDGEGGGEQLTPGGDNAAFKAFILFYGFGITLESRWIAR